MNEQMVQRQPQKLTFSQYVNSKSGQALINNVIHDQGKREAFVTAIISAVSINPTLQQCTFPSIMAAALQGVSLGLAPSPQLGQFYMVPFDCNIKDDASGEWRKEKRAQFVPGYKGYIQLAFRSGLYVDIDAQPIVEGEYKGRDRYTGRPVFQFLEDDALRETLPVIGYMAYFELVNGARKVIYWSKEKMLSHADRYSPAFSKEATSGRNAKVSFADYEAGNYPKNDEWKYSSFWYKDFNSMANKTMLRQLLTKWGPLSIEMETAITRDVEQEEAEEDYGIAPAALPEAISGEEPSAPVQEDAEDVETPPVLRESKPGKKAKRQELSLDDL